MLILLAMVLTSCRNKDANYDSVTLQSATRILRKSVLQAKLITTDSTGFIMTCRLGNKIIDHLKPGDILVVESGSGLICKVTGISKMNNAIIVSTTRAHLTDAIMAGELKINQKLTTTMVQSVRAISPGISIKTAGIKPGMGSDAIVLEYTISETVGNQEITVLKGLFGLVPSFRLSTVIQGAKLVKYRADYSVEIDLNNTVDSFVSGLAHAFISEAEVTFSNVTVMFGPVPVIIQPRLTVEIGVEPGQIAKEPASATQPFTYASWVEYDPVKNWTSGGAGTPDMNPNSNPALKFNPLVRPSGKVAMVLLLNGECYPPLSATENKKPTSELPEDSLHTILPKVKDSSSLKKKVTQPITVTDSKKAEISPVTAAIGFLTDTRDGNSYPFKKIGNQTWMIKNLAWLPSVSPSSEGSDNSPFYYINGYDGSNVSAAKATANYAAYGVLYNWEAAKQACPEGWHLPTDNEWKTLEKYLGMSETDAGTKDSWRESGTVGGKLKESGSAKWKTPNEGATNTSGFAALPGGYRGSLSGGAFGLGTSAYFWTSSASGSSAWNRYLYYHNGGVTRLDDSRSYGFSVRCLKNN